MSNGEMVVRTEAVSLLMLEALRCQEDMELFVSVNSGTRIEIVSRWLDRINELCPIPHSTHEAHASWTQWAFCDLCHKLRRNAIAQANQQKGEDTNV